MILASSMWTSEERILAIIIHTNGHKKVEQKETRPYILKRDWLGK